MKLRTTLFCCAIVAQFGERFLLRFARGKIERLRGADVFRDGGVDESVEIFEAERGEHRADFVVVRADVPGDEAAQFSAVARAALDDFWACGEAVSSSV